MSDADPTSDVSALTVQLLSAYLANNTVPSEQLAELIRSTRAALTDDTSALAQPVEPEQFTPAVSVRKSLASPEHIVSLIDGKSYKTLKRHLAAHGLTPQTYRSRYNLPASYPMVAPTYADHRREVAQRLGLGRREPKPEVVEQPQKAAPQEPSDAEIVAAQRALAPIASPSAKARSKGGARKASEPAAGKQDTSSDPGVTAAAVTLSKDDGANTIDVVSPEESGAAIGKTAEAMPKAKARSRKSSKQGEAPPIKSGAQVSEGPDQAVGNAGEAQPPKRKAAKRRGKIGLFKKADPSLTPEVAGAGASASSSPNPGTTLNDQGEKGPGASTKRRPTKRMARTPKSDAS